MDAIMLLLVFAAATLATYLVVTPADQSAVVRQRAMVVSRSSLASHRKDNGVLIDEDLEKPFAQRVLAPIRKLIVEALARLMPANMNALIAKRLEQAGNPMTSSEFLGVKAMASAGLSLFGLMIALARNNISIGILLMLIFLVIGWIVPEFWLGNRGKARKKLLAKSLPDVLDVLSVSVEAGLGLDGAIQKVGEKFPEPTAGEFRELLKTVRLGKPRAEALRELADRVDLPDMRTFAASVIQAEQLGVSISRVLRVQSEAVRTRRKQAVQEKAMSLPVKMLIPLILFIFPTIFIVALGPVVIGFFVK